MVVSDSKGVEYLRCMATRATRAESIVCTTFIVGDRLEDIDRVPERSDELVGGQSASVEDEHRFIPSRRGCIRDEPSALILGTPRLESFFLTILNLGVVRSWFTLVRSPDCIHSRTPYLCGFQWSSALYLSCDQETRCPIVTLSKLCLLSYLRSTRHERMVMEENWPRC